MCEIMLMFDQNFIPFTVTKLITGKTVWINKKVEQHLGFDTDSEKFRDEFSYVIREASCFRSLGFDCADTKVYQAERYGGKGIGKNGGGARSGSIGRFQIKGIGPNVLVSSGGEHHHAYGGLDAPHAINETIYSVVLSEILPLGTVNICGLIATGGKTAFEVNGDECVGMLLVRESCVRPAHFLRAPSFSSPEASIPSDLTRIRSLHHYLRKKTFRSDAEFMNYVASFLVSCANQFSFAQVARIMNSTLSPSNLSMDGRWLDIPMASFLSGGVNYGQASQFYSEYEAPLQAASEIVDMYSKYNRVQLDFSSLVMFYFKEYHAYYLRHAGYIFSIPFAKMELHANNDYWRFLFSSIQKIILSGKEIQPKRATPDKNDPIVMLVMGLFLSLVDTEKSNLYLSRLHCLSEFERGSLVPAFFEFYSQTINQESASKPEKGIAISLAIRSLRRSILSGSFYLPNIDDETRYICKNGFLDEVPRYINECYQTAKWIFNENETDQAIIFSCESVHFSYALNSDEYELRINNNEVFLYKSINEPLKFLLNMTPSLKLIRRFDPVAYLEKLYELVEPLERMR